MKKGLLLLLAPALFMNTAVDSTEIDFTLSNQENYQLNYKVTDTYYTEIPENPNVYFHIDTYIDRELTQKSGSIEKNQIFKIVDCEVNNYNQVVFLLEDGQYILADTNAIYDDVILESDTTQEVFWLKKDFKIYSSPIGNKQIATKTSLTPYQAVTISEIVTTPTNKFAKIDGQGWVNVTDLSQEDNRIEKVQELLNEKYSSNANISIYVKQLSTQNTAGIHENTMMYAASTSKLPVLYYAQEKINQKAYALTEGLQYVDKVNDFEGAYATEGSGTMSKTADNRYYRIDELINKVAKESDNAASNLLAYYTTNQFDKKYYSTVTAITGEKWDMVSREASAQMAGLMMEALYYQSGYVLESLQSTQFDNQRISRDIPVTVAHKIGDAYDFKHDVAVVYAESPFVLSIFTNESDYDTISQIANDIYGILK